MPSFSTQSSAGRPFVSNLDRRPTKRITTHLDSAKFFVAVPAAKRVRLGVQQRHMFVHLGGRPGIVFGVHADCDSPSKQREPAVKGRCALCGIPSCTRGCTVCHVRLCVDLRAGDATRSCAEMWHDAGCDLESERKILRRQINEQQKKKREVKN